MSALASTRVMIVGAGLGGALMACFLAPHGAQVTVYERRPDPRARGFTGGRSINLALSTRGIHALRQVGLAERVLADAVPMRGRMIHSPTGQLAFQPYSANPHDAINSVSRGGLNITLLEAAAAHPNVRLAFDHRCVDVDLDTPAATFVIEGTGEAVRAEADIIIGADGSYSAVRGQMQKFERFDYEQSYLDHGYKELTIPAVTTGEHAPFAMAPHALHIWPRGGYMMIALPNQDGSFTCTCFWPYAGPNGFEAVHRAEDVLDHFRGRFPDAVPLMPTLVDEYMRNPVGALVTIRCRPWRHGGKVVLLGDAAHAIVPFYGQGMNAAFEDCVALADCLRQRAPDFEAAFSEFEAMRRENSEAIADLALENFIEMRDKTASPLFRMRKKAEKVLHKVFPSAFMPLYNMISFSLIPYAEARRRARRQAAVIALGAIAIGVTALAVVAALLTR